jgi:hypothetical protein
MEGVMFQHVIQIIEALLRASQAEEGSGSPIVSLQETSVDGNNLTNMHHK